MSQKQYYTIEEVEEIVQRNRATIYNRMKVLGIKAKKFKLDRKSYLTASDVERIKTVFEQPWTLGEKPEEEDAAYPLHTLFEVDQTLAVCAHG